MTTTLKAEPGTYVYDESNNRFVGRLNQNGTEDKRFTNGGLCSLLNSVLEVTDYKPKDPQAYAKALCTREQNSYALNGFTVLLTGLQKELTPEEWCQLAAQEMPNDPDGLADILAWVSMNRHVEFDSKVGSLINTLGKSALLKQQDGPKVYKEMLKQHRLMQKKRDALNKRNKRAKDLRKNRGEKFWECLRSKQKLHCTNNGECCVSNLKNLNWEARYLILMASYGLETEDHDLVDRKLCELAQHWDSWSQFGGEFDRHGALHYLDCMAENLGYNSSEALLVELLRFWKLNYVPGIDEEVETSIEEINSDIDQQMDWLEQERASLIAEENAKREAHQRLMDKLND